MTLDGLDNSPDEMPPNVTCWRCGRMVVLQAACPHCAAALGSAHEVETSSARETAADLSSLLRVLAVFAVMLAISLIGGFVLQARASWADAANPNSRDVFVPVGVLESLDTVLVLIALVWIPQSRTPGCFLGRMRSWAWLAAFPLLAAVLAANVGYHWWLVAFGREDSLHRLVRAQPESLLVWLPLSCIQPAVIEELFFRYLAFNSLSRVMSVKATVVVTAAMFCLAHIYVPASLPVLFLLGLSLGWARAASGGMVLPMLLHFLHNLAVIGINYYFA
jgi:uncharacterized protein